MNTENNSIFDGWIINRKIYENEEYETYLVTKNTPSGTNIRHLRVMQVKTEQFTTGADQYPPKIRKMINSVELMQKLINCKNIVNFYNYRVVDRGEGVYALVILTDPLIPLKEKYDIKNMPVEEALKIVSAVCGAVEDYRRMGITDRKIMPENIFVSPSGDIQLGDFGILSTYIPDEDYLSPEEYSVSGYAKQTDIYALGMLLFKLLNHDRAPFLPAYPTEITDENRSNAFKRRMNGEVPTSPEGVPDSVAPIIAKVCAFDPADRYSSLSVLKSDIDSVISGFDPLYGLSKTATTGYNFEQAVLSETEPKPEARIEPEDIPVDDDYDDSEYIPDTSRESRNIIIGFIVAIAVIVAFTVGFIVYTISKKPNTESTTESTTASTTTQAVSSTEETTEETTEESTTEETTTEESTTEETTTETTTEETTTEPTTTEPTTDATTSAPVITSPASAYINVSGATAQTYSDGERVDEILITIPVSFGSAVHSKDSVVLYTYDSEGKIVKTDSVDFSCYYSDESSKNTVCDIYLPDDVNVDTETYTYRLSFGKGVISGSLGSNNAFTVEIS